MRRLGYLPAAGRRYAVIGLGLALMLMLPSATSWAQQAASTPQKPTGMVFGSDAGIVFNTIKPGKTADFEMIMGKLKQALQSSTNPQRKQQAASWKVFKSVEPGPNGNALYLFVIDPAVPNADYTVAKILDEAFPQQIEQLYKTFASCYVPGGQSVVNLKLVDNFGQ
ncbi:MAG TPA: hypothetical protein VNE16_09300 [Vicinamibacterales bacterium]|nr:hypothetical protein [Vicinamibacterales bacterium]